MSTVRYFDDIPHIGRFGMRNDKKEKSWFLFWRVGTQFTIHVDKKGVEGTTFYSEWRQLLSVADFKPGDSMKEHIQNWEKFCDLIISNSMATLQSLAPLRPYWVTLEDYLSTPAYELKIVANSNTDNVSAEVLKGPEYVGAYEFQPIPATTLENFSEKTPHYASRDLIVEGKEKNWKHPPYDVRTADGTLLYFKALRRSHKSGENGKIVNPSMDSIEAYMRFFSRCQQDNAAAKCAVLGVVMHSPRHTGEELQGETVRDQPFVAGVVLSSAIGKRTLADVVDQSGNTDTIIHQIQRWKTQILEEITYLHGAGIYFGKNGWGHNNLDRGSILINNEDDAILSLDSASVDSSSVNKDVVTTSMALDRQVIDDIFGELLSV